MGIIKPTYNYGGPTFYVPVFFLGFSGLPAVLSMDPSTHRFHNFFMCVVVDFVGPVEVGCSIRSPTGV